MQSVVNGHLKLLNTKEASRYLLDEWGVRRAPTTLIRARYSGTGPVFRLIGDSQVGYTAPELDGYAQSLISEPLRSTAEEA